MNNQDRINYYNHCEEHLRKCDYKRITNFAENLILRANDLITYAGQEKFDIKKEVFEKILEEKYKNDEVYKYYYELPKVKHGFCTFGRWKLGMLF